MTAGSSYSSGLVVLSTGRLAEFIFLSDQGAMATGEVTSVAQAAASRIDALPGS